MTHTIEPELQLPPPRRVRTRGFAQYSCARLFILPHCLVGLGMLLGVPAATALYLLTLVAGQTMTAEVISKQSQRGKRGETYTITYALRTAPGDELTRATVGVRHAAYLAMKPGDTFDVLASPVLPGMAHWTSIASQSGWLKLGGLWLIGLFWNGILSVFIHSLYVVPLRQRRLVSHGQPVLAKVTTSDTVHAGRGRLQRELRYAYRAPGPDGGEQLFEGRARIDLTGSEPSEGELITVLYNPRRPQSSVPYLGSGVEALPADGESPGGYVSER